MKEIKVCVGVHVDAVAGWLGSYEGQDSPNDIQRGMFAGEVGMPRVRQLLQRRVLPATWFIPGHSIETFPQETEDVAAAGFEIAVHGYSHENPVAMSPQQEADVLGRCVSLIEKFTGSRPKGYVAPWWEMSEYTAQLLLDNGFSYDNSQSYHDFLPFYARVGDTWTNVDYSKEASEWMKPLVRGHEVDLVEIAANWYVDDLPPMMYIKGYPNSHGFVAPQVIEQLWKDQFDWIYREMDYAVFPFTIHPDVSGRPQVLMMLERVFDHIDRHPGVQWCTFAEVADDFRQRFPFEATR
ncbi:polysaccharide deacetylase [Scrofimicrobium sp. R131]|uniref:Polysaccharide deacetylase n=1 Tax=Scrofimicrobium appendicitidis TaxID=3079930 RepID=A0AAU7V8E1_9ACTO